MSKKKFERIVEFSPAFDKRHEDHKKNYGIGAVNIRFVLRKGKKAVQFLMGTNWYLQKTIKEYIKEKYIDLRLPTLYKTNDTGKSFDCWDLGYHSPKRMYDSQTPISDDCLYTKGKCYYDGSGLNSEVFHNILLEKGSNGVWEELEKYWNNVFGVEK